MSRYQSVVAIGTAITITVSGCAQMGGSKSTEYTVTGCASGGLLAGAGTYVANIGDKGAEKKAAIAGMLGCLAGSVVAYTIDLSTEKYRDAQHAMSSEMARIEAEINDLQQFNAKTEKSIEDDKKLISDVKGTAMSEQETMENRKKTKETVANHLSENTKQLRTNEAAIARANKQYNTYQAEMTPQERDKWQAKLDSYETTKEILERNGRTLEPLVASAGHM